MSGPEEQPVWSLPEGPDRTAVGAAIMRARHLLLEGEPKIFKDEFAIRLTGAPEEFVRNPPFLDLNSAVTATPWVLRSRYTEDCLEVARKRGISQYVILGAGLDSFALRHAATPSDLVVFEVDAPRTQDWKRKRIAELSIDLPKNLRLAPCDFENTSIEAALGAAGFRFSKPAFLCWLGVTQYLTRDAIDETLKWAAGLAPVSEIVLTFVIPSPEALEDGKRVSARAGVNFETFFTPEEMAATLRAAGFAKTEYFSPQRAEQVYFVGRTDGLHAPELEQLMRAWTS